MSDVDRMFQDVVNPWWDHNRMATMPDFDALRAGISLYSALCRHAAWNEIGRWFIRAAGGGEKRELLGLQCLVEALLASPTNDSAAWTAFAGATRPELIGLHHRLSELPRRPDPGDEEANLRLVEELRTILGEPGTTLSAAAPTLEFHGNAETSVAATSSSSATHQRRTPASPRTAALPELRDSGDLIRHLEKNFAPPEWRYAFFLTPGELCDIAERYADLYLIKWNDHDRRLSAERDVLLVMKWKATPNVDAIRVVGLYVFRNASEARTVWTDKGVYGSQLPVERVLDIRGRYALNFQSGSYSYAPSDLEDITVVDLWSRICGYCQDVGAPIVW